jgi:hypothetical protein
VLVIALCLLSTTAAAQAVDLPASQVDFARWVFTQGGLTVALILALYFYRKDFQHRAASAEDDRDRAIEALTKMTAAMADHASTSIRLCEAVENLDRSALKALARRHASSIAAPAPAPDDRA